MRKEKDNLEEEEEGKKKKYQRPRENSQGHKCVKRADMLVIHWCFTEERFSLGQRRISHAEHGHRCAVSLRHPLPPSLFFTASTGSTPTLTPPPPPLIASPRIHLLPLLLYLKKQKTKQTKNTRMFFERGKKKRRRRRISLLPSTDEGATGRQQAAMGARCPLPNENIPPLLPPPLPPTQLYLKATIGISLSSVLLKLTANTPKQQTELCFVWVCYLLLTVYTSARRQPCVHLGPWSPPTF